MMSWLMRKILLFGENESCENIPDGMGVVFRYKNLFIRPDLTHKTIYILLCIFLSFLCVIHLCSLNYLMIHLLSLPIMFYFQYCYKTISVYYLFCERIFAHACHTCMIIVSWKGKIKEANSTRTRHKSRETCVKCTHVCERLTKSPWISLSINVLFKWMEKSLIFLYV
jgi:hypothetical protein